MNAAQIFQLIEQGLALLPILIDAGVNIEKHIEQLIALSKAGAAGGMTAEQLASIRSGFDAALDDFNKPMDP